MQQPKIFLIGLMGSGKSYWGRHLALHFRFPFLDLDKGIEMAENRSISEIFEQEGEAWFRNKEREILRQLHHDYSRFVMSCGGGTPCFFDNMDWMKEHGLVLWLKPPLEVLAQRLISGRDKRPLIRHTGSEAEIIEVLSALMQHRLSFYQQSQLVMEEPFPTIETFENLLKHA